MQFLLVLAYLLLKGFLNTLFKNLYYNQSYNYRVCNYKNKTASINRTNAVIAPYNNNFDD